VICNSRVGLVEAVPVELAGQRFSAVLVDGAAHLIPGAVFDLFFSPVAAVDPETESLRERAKKLASSPAFQKAAKELDEVVGSPVFKAIPVKQVKAGESGHATRSPHPSEKDGLSTGQAIRKAIGEGPQTTAEIQDRVCHLMGWQTNDKMARDRIYSTIWVMAKAGKIVKKTDPATQLSKLYPGIAE
jgi:hypothetical protein